MGRDTTLTSHQFHVLMALAESDRHGLGVMQAVLDQTDGRLRLWPAILYRTLDRLVADGSIAERPAPPSMAGSPRFFHLTARGRRACEAEARRLAAIVETARTRRLLGGS
jgi:DNA-binding PadR family transcriptional regulator